MDTKHNTYSIVLAGGGTRGHATPLTSVVEYLRQSISDASIAWYGNAHSMEEALAKEYGIDFFVVPSQKLDRTRWWKTVTLPINVLRGIWVARRLLRKHGAKVVFCKGWFAAVPTTIGAWTLGIDVILHESDRMPGLANRVVGRFAKKVFLGFDGTQKYFAPKTNPEVVGQIFSLPMLQAVEKTHTVLPEAHTKPHLIVTLGSQGASRVYDFLLSHPSIFDTFETRVILGTLATHYRERFAKYPQVTVYDLLPQTQLAECYAWADVALARAGALSLEELAAMGVHTLIVPLEETGGNHQVVNAKYFVQKHQNMRILMQSELNTYGEQALQELATLRTQTLQKEEKCEPITQNATETVTRYLEKYPTH